jgi:hypothetical protein
MVHFGHQLSQGLAFILAGMSFICPLDESAGLDVGIILSAIVLSMKIWTFWQWLSIAAVANCTSKQFAHA